MKSAILWRISRRFSSAVTTSYRAAETGDTGAGGGGRLSARAKTPGRLTPAGNAGCSACGAAGPAFRSEGSVWLYAGNRCDIP
uniref:Uncharacterized protein n=1 Tax=Escherichia coli TaxID=562 RepID=A0A2K9V1L5_ECOLX|nr:hypothetical protein [Escherichia coli]